MQDIYNKIKEDLQFTEIYTPLSKEGRDSYPDDNIDACIYDVIHGNIDVCVGYIWETLQRRSYGVNFTQSILYDDLGLYYYDKDAILKEQTMYDIFYFPFSNEFWYALLCVVIVHSIGRLILEYDNSYLRGYSILSKLYYCILSSLSGIIYYEEIQAETWPGRVLDFSMKFFKFLFFTLYISTFSMVLNERDNPIKDLNKLILNRKKIVTKPGNMLILTNVFKETYGLYNIENEYVYSFQKSLDMFNFIKEGNASVVFTYKSDDIFNYLKKDGYCEKIYKMKNQLYKVGSSYPINENYNQQFSTAISNLIDKGTINKLISEYNFDSNECLLEVKERGSMYDLNKLIFMFYLVYSISAIGLIVAILQKLLSVFAGVDAEKKMEDDDDDEEVLEDDYIYQEENNTMVISDADAKDLIMSINKLNKILSNGDVDVINYNSLLLGKYEVMLRKRE